MLILLLEMPLEMLRNVEGLELLFGIAFSRFDVIFPLQIADINLLPLISKI